jgi:CspA family cold shock protein
MKGTVKTWKMSYGFIATEENKKDVFVHESDIQSGSYLTEGTKVKFDLVEEARGPKAVHVEIIE